MSLQHYSVYRIHWKTMKYIPIYIMDFKHLENFRYTKKLYENVREGVKVAI